MVDQVQYKQYTELDFQRIKDSLKAYFRNQNELKDFDFEGSVMNVVINMLAYNTQYNGYYLNMLASEKFIRSAQKRESVVGSANNIGYVPFSRKSASAYPSFTITPTAGYTSSIIIPKNTKFSTSIDGISYSFLTTQNTVVLPTSSGYNVSNLEIKEGRYFNFKFTIGATDKFLQIPNKGVDTNRITVTVKESSSAINSVVYSKYTTLINLTSTSQVYYIQEGINGLYEIYFGDGILGKALSIGNEVTIEYYVTNGNVANSAKSFTLDDSVTGISSVTFTSVLPSSGGALEETVDSIRISAPTNYQAQNRAITELDYQVLVKQIYPQAKQVSAIGGQNYIPRQFGKVFISILKNDLSVLSFKDKSDILLQLNTNYASLTVIPVVVDPYIIRMLINTNVTYSKKTTSNESEIKTTAFNAIKSFVTSDLNSFKYTLRKSKFEAIIDNSLKDILSNTSVFQLYIDTNDNVIPTKSNSLNFGQSIKQKSLYSSAFTYTNVMNCQFIDVDGLGYASVYTKSQNGDLILINKNVFSIDYASGLLTYSDSNYTLYSLSLLNSSGIRVFTTPVADDIKVINNSVIYVKDADITISTSVEV